MAAVLFVSCAMYTPPALPQAELAPEARDQASGATAPPINRRAHIKQTVPAPNPFTIGIAAGPTDGTNLRIASDFSTLLARGQETGPKGEVALRVVPLVGQGGVQVVRDVLTLPGVDLGIAPALLLNRLRETQELGKIEEKLAYISVLHIEEFHLLVSAKVRSLSDLADRNVNLGEDGSATRYLGRDVFEKLAMRIKEHNLPQQEALERMRQGEIDATVFVTGKPSLLIAALSRNEGFRLLPLPFTPPLDQDYLPATLTADDYPRLIESNGPVETLAVSSVLIAYKWPLRSQRHRLLETFVRSFFSRVPEFQSGARHPKWREVNLAAELPGWQRFAPATRLLKQVQPAGLDAERTEFEQFLGQVGSTSSTSADRDRLFREFLNWKRQKR